MATPNTTVLGLDLDKLQGWASSTKTPAELLAGAEKGDDIQSSASEIDGKCTFNNLTLDIDGDSIASLNLDLTYARGSVGWGNGLLGQPFTLINNFGVGGERTDNILARISTTLESNSKYIHYIMGKNDVIQDKTYADIISNMDSIYSQCIEKGKIVIASTIIPSESDTQLQSELINKLNMWIVSQQNVYKNYVVIDYYSSFVDQSTGLSKIGYTVDGIHPSAEGAYFMGLEFKEVLENLLPKVSKFSNNNTITPTQIVSNSLMIDGATTATDWSGGATNTKETIDGEIWQVITSTDVTASYFYQSIYDGWSEGDIVSGLVEFEVTDVNQLDFIGCNITVRDLSSIILTAQGWSLESYNKPSTQELHRVIVKIPEFEVPVGAVRLLPYFLFELNGTVKINKFQIFNHSV